jgi:hypothetical protein
MIERIRTDGARLRDLGELERVKIILDVDRSLFERGLAKEGVRRGRRGRGLRISLVRPQGRYTTCNFSRTPSALVLGDEFADGPTAVLGEA